MKPPVRKVLNDQGEACAWCGYGLAPSTVEMVKRETCWLGFCWSCIRRYNDPVGHPYLRRCLERQGR